MCPKKNLRTLGIHFVELKGKPSYKQLDLFIKHLQSQYIDENILVKKF